MPGLECHRNRAGGARRTGVLLGDALPAGALTGVLRGLALKALLTTAPRPDLRGLAFMACGAILRGAATPDLRGRLVCGIFSPVDVNRDL